MVTYQQKVDASLFCNYIPMFFIHMFGYLNVKPL